MSITPPISELTSPTVVKEKAQRAPDEVATAAHRALTQSNQDFARLPTERPLLPINLEGTRPPPETPTSHPSNMRRDEAFPPSSQAE